MMRQRDGRDVFITMTVKVPRANEVRTYLCLAKAKIWLIICKVIKIIFRG